MYNNSTSLKSNFSPRAQSENKRVHLKRLRHCPADGQHTQITLTNPHSKMKMVFREKRSFLEDSSITLKMEGSS